MNKQQRDYRKSKRKNPSKPFVMADVTYSSTGVTTSVPIYEIVYSPKGRISRWIRTGWKTETKTHTEAFDEASKRLRN